MGISLKNCNMTLVEARPRSILLNQRNRTQTAIMRALIPPSPTSQLDQKYILCCILFSKFQI